MENISDNKTNIQRTPPEFTDKPEEGQKDSETVTQSVVETILSLTHSQQLPIPSQVSRPKIEELRQGPKQMFEESVEGSADRVGLTEAQDPKKLKQIATSNKTQQIEQRTWRSLEVGDKPILHDTLFNYIPASCLEIGMALSILENPGLAGETMDQFAAQLSDMLDTVYNTEVGNLKVIHNGKEKTLRELFNEKLLKEIHPDSDQIGRYPIKDNQAIKDQWYKGEGKQWLQEQLKISSQNKDTYSPMNMLTKIRMISALGTIIRESTGIESNRGSLAKLFNKETPEFFSRFSEIKENLRHAGFDSTDTRKRSERAPIVGEKSLAGRKLFDAGPKGLGFGEVYVDESFGEGAEEIELRRKYNELLTLKGRGGIPRLGTVITDEYRPGITSDFAFEHMPDAFKKAGLQELMERNAFSHGTGINRWQLKGSYPKESWDQDLPAAGAHSGGTVDILLAMNCLSTESINGQKEIVLPAALLISSFMNFGGYHSFVETFPIAEALAKGHIFQVKVSEKQKTNLYSHISEAVKAYSPDASASVENLRKAHKNSLKEMSRNLSV